MTMNNHILAALAALNAGAALANVRVEFPGPLSQGPPYYAQISNLPGQGLQAIHNDEWAAIPFFRELACVPPGSNLLDIRAAAPGAFGCTLTVQGFEIRNGFELAIRIQPEDIDELGHVNNVVYLRWVQDVAIAHWNVLSTPEDREMLVWVVVRHEIDYRIAAMPEDAIIARTWVGPATRFRFERNTEILRGTDRTVLAKARTEWCPIDPRTGRPANGRHGIRPLCSTTFQHDR